MRKWIIGLALLALLIYAGRALVLSFESGARDIHRAEDDLVRMRAEKKAAQVERAMKTGQEERIQQLQRATRDAQ